MLPEQKIFSPHANYFEGVPSQDKLKQCTNARSVLLTYNERQDKLLLSLRSKWPKAWSLIAEHIEDGKTAYEEAAKGLFQETGLRPSDLTGLHQIESDAFVTFDTCRRNGRYHNTVIYEGVANTDRVQPNHEAIWLKWISLEDLAMLAQRTQTLLRGELPEEEYLQNPGLIPASIQVLQHRGLLTAIL